MQCVQKHQDWAIDKRKGVAWLDESWFLIHHIYSRVRMRRFPNEQMFSTCTAGHTQVGGGTIMLRQRSSWIVIVGCGRTYHESGGIAKYNCCSVVPIHDICLLNWRWDLPAGQHPIPQRYA
ncbi:DDE_3 domain-containing protein [Trichonephila clavipes]|nr:DDE_3 domain-containing protein [Trichonephila clavipes]